MRTQGRYPIYLGTIQGTGSTRDANFRDKRALREAR